MDTIKKIGTWLVANKKSLLSTIVGAAGTGVGIAASWSIDSLPQIFVGEFNIAPIIYTVVCLIGFILNELGICGRGFETIVSYMANTEAKTEKKKELAVEKAAKKELEKAQKAADEEEKRIKTAALKQAEEDIKAKEAAEFAKKVELMKAQLMAQNNKK